MNISEDLIRRMSNYRRVLYKLKSLGFINVFSDNLGDALNISSTQVRKDFSMFKITGKKKGGYDVNETLKRLNDILGKNQVQNVVVIGCGKMGRALIEYIGFTAEGMKIVAGFDTDPLLVDNAGRIPIYDISELGNVVNEFNVKVAIMTVPESSASQLIEVLENAGIKGILNFAPIELKSRGNCRIHNLSIILELENMIYFVNHLDDKIKI
jgi:redox-sensing transcriptional repressor